MNCPIREHTADRISVGRCWHFVGTEAPFRCPRHGDVTEPVRRFAAEKKLTNDYEHRANMSRAPSEPGTGKVRS